MTGISRLLFMNNQSLKEIINNTKNRIVNGQRTTFNRDRSRFRCHSLHMIPFSFDIYEVAEYMNFDDVNAFGVCTFLSLFLSYCIFL